MSEETKSPVAIQPSTEAPKELTQKEINELKAQQLGSMKSQIEFLKVRKTLVELQRDITVAEYQQADANFRHLQILNAWKQQPAPEGAIEEKTPTTTTEAPTETTEQSSSVIS